MNFNKKVKKNFSSGRRGAALHQFAALHVQHQLLKSDGTLAPPFAPCESIMDASLSVAACCSRELRQGKAREGRAADCRTSRSTNCERRSTCLTLMVLARLT